MFIFAIQDTSSSSSQPLAVGSCGRGHIEQGIEIDRGGREQTTDTWLAGRSAGGSTHPGCTCAVAAGWAIFLGSGHGIARERKTTCG